MANSAPFRRVSIIGTGLIGGSFALALRKHFPDIYLTGYDQPETAALALQRGTVSEIAKNISDAVRGANLVYIALPIGAAMESLAAISAAAEPDALVTDACSTKIVLCAEAKKHFSRNALFLGGHPMAGKQNSGFGHADAELFRGAPYALIGSGDNLDEREARFKSLLDSIGAQSVWCDAETHDWSVGIVSHLPQLAAIALARVVADETDETGLPLTLAGQGLQDSLRLAGSPYTVWRDIILTNKENIGRALDRLAQAVDHLRTHLASKELEQEFSSANDLYKLLRKPR